MFRVVNLKKVYHEKEPVTALEDINIQFDRTGLVFILGPSGSGKTALLSCLGGLDSYDEGDIIINGESTKDFVQTDWSVYRSKYIGFVFQEDNLIPNLSVRQNVELPLKLAGVKKAQLRERTEQIIAECKLEPHLKKPVTHLSGGEKQRLGLARALANDPKIILLDEATASLDAASTELIMEQIKAISKERLIIFVTHKEDMAKRYADRIIRLEKGRIVADKMMVEKKKPAKATDATDEIDVDAVSKHRGSKVAWFSSAFGLAMNSIKTRKLRTTMASVAITFGIVTLSLVLALTTGFDGFMSKARKEHLNMPITIAPVVSKTTTTTNNYSNDKINSIDMTHNIFRYNSVINDTFFNTLQDGSLLSPDLYNAIQYERAMDFNLLISMGKPYESDTVTLEKGSELGFQEVDLTQGVGGDYPITNFYEKVSGNWLMGNSDAQIMLVLDEYNRVDSNTLKLFGLDPAQSQINYNAMVGKQIKIVPNSLYYAPPVAPNTIFGIQNAIDKDSYHTQNPSLKTLTIVGVIRPYADAKVKFLKSGFVYSHALTEYMTETETAASTGTQSATNVIAAQRIAFATNKKSVITGATITEAENNALLAVLGAKCNPVAINIYPKGMKAMEEIKNIIAKWNADNRNSRVVYVDPLSETSKIVGGITSILGVVALSAILVAAFSLAVISYNNTQSDVKNIAIMRSCGARKRSIATMVISETAIVGLVAGIAGTLIGLILFFPFNAIIAGMVGASSVAKVAIWHPLVLILSALGVTISASVVPAIAASRRDPAKVLRSHV